MSFFISTEPYEREIESPSGEKGTVKLRRLNAGDQAAIQDTLRMSLGDDGTDSSLALGTMRMLTVKRALIDWSWRPSPTPELIAQLDPDVFEQIYSHVEMGVPPTSTNGASASTSQDGETVTPKKTRQRSAAAS